MPRTIPLITLLFCASCSAILSAADQIPPAADQAPPNLLIITVDDMSADSLGAFGCKLADTSPRIDAFARRALRFKHAHVQVGNCMPGRNIMWSGMFAHKTGVEGFVQNRDADYPVLCDLAKDAGYFAAIRGKVSHSTPYTPYAWDAVLDTTADGKKLHVKDAEGYGFSTRRGIDLAKQAGKPFCLLVNISDPHKPFYAQGRGGETIDDPHAPSRVFTADEVPVPGFLPSDGVIRKELAHYYSSVRRADDCFGEIMSALDESGQADNTFVIFFSDHGMPFPFAKTQLYHHSTHTPLMVRWPGVTKPGSIDNHHMVSAVDLIPTLTDVMGHQHPAPDRLHGRSFAEALRGQTQADRDHVVLQYNENSGRSRHPMRGIHTRDYLYLYNPWSDGERKFATATTGTMTYRQMVTRAPAEPDIAARLALFDHRVVEELYHISSDPDCLVNLIDDPDHQQELNGLRDQLAKELVRIDDPVAPVFAAGNDAAVRAAYMTEQDERTRKARQARQNRNGAAKPRTRQLRGAISLDPPDQVTKGGKCSIVVHHKIPKALGTQKLHVTLKTASLDPQVKADQRIHREVLSVTGSGEIKIEFEVPNSEKLSAIRVAAFIGEDFPSNLQHLNTDPIPVK
jgi:N-sulfoglucosamine sulfohydrolase